MGWVAICQGFIRHLHNCTTPGCPPCLCLGLSCSPLCAVPFSQYWLLSCTKNQAKEISDIEDVSTDLFPASRQTLSTASDSRIPYTTNSPASVLPTALAQNPPLRTKLGDAPSTAAIPMWTVQPSLPLFHHLFVPKLRLNELHGNHCSSILTLHFVVVPIEK